MGCLSLCPRHMSSSDSLLKLGLPMGPSILPGGRRGLVSIPSQCRLHLQIISFECSAIIMTQGVWPIKAGVFSPPPVTSIVFSDSLCTSQPPSSNCKHHDLLQSLLCSLFRRSRSRCSSTREGPSSGCRRRYVLLEGMSIRHKLNQTNIGVGNVVGAAVNAAVENVNVNALSSNNKNNNN